MSRAPARPAFQSCRLTMRGYIKLRRWLPFTADVTLTPRPRLRLACRVGGVISGQDRYVDHAETMEWRLAGVVPVPEAPCPTPPRSGPGVTVARPNGYPGLCWLGSGLTWSSNGPDAVTCRAVLVDVAALDTAESSQPNVAWRARS
jgi:hypothetical protein